MATLPRGAMDAALKHRAIAKGHQAEREALQSLKTNDLGGVVVGDTVQAVDFKGKRSAAYPPYCNTGGLWIPG